MQPTRSYIIWFSQRTGSTLLCKALESTGIAGRPGEWLWDPETFDLCTSYGVRNMEEVREKLWERGSTSNGVCAVKFGMFEPHHSLLLEQFRQLPGSPTAPKRPAVAWERMYPNCRHLFMTRRNKVRLAVSWRKAFLSQQWHLARGEDASAPDLAGEYDRDNIQSLVIEATLREAAIAEIFVENDIVPLTIAYEDFISDFDGTVRKIIEFLGIPVPGDLDIDAPRLEKLADDLSEQWVQRFRDDVQQGWQNRGW